MTSKDKFWPIGSEQSALASYLEHARDRSSSINAGQRVSDLRSLLDVSPQELAEKCEITTNELLALEAGLMQLKPALAERLAKQLGVEYTDLYLSDENQE